MDENRIRETLQVIDLIWSIALFVFFVYQRLFKNRCKFEVLYVTGVGSVTDLVKLVATDKTPGSITIAENDVVLNWSQYFGWMVTCPVLLIHLSNLAGTDTFDARRMMKILVAYQILMLSGVTASMTERDDPLKWVLFTLAVTCLSVVFRFAYHIFLEATKIMPRRAIKTLQVIAAIFYVSWSGFGVFWVLGPTGSNLVSDQVSKAAFAFFDILSKNVYSMCGWYLRWYILRKFDKPQEFANQEVNDDDVTNKRVSVFLVETNSIYTHFFTQQLAQQDFDVTCGSGFNDILKICNQPYDALFINFEIAQWNNFEIMYNIRATLPHIPVIAYGNSIDPSFLVNRHATGIDDFISAPFPDNILKKKIMQWSRRASIVPAKHIGDHTTTDPSKKSLHEHLAYLQSTLDHLKREIV